MEEDNECELDKLCSLGQQLLNGVRGGIGGVGSF